MKQQRNTSKNITNSSYTIFLRYMNVYVMTIVIYQYNPS